MGEAHPYRGGERSADRAIKRSSRPASKKVWAKPTPIGAGIAATAIGISNFESETVTIFLTMSFVISLIVVVVNRVRLRMKTLEIFGFNKYLGLLGLAGLGYITDFLCGFSKRSLKKGTRRNYGGGYDESNLRVSLIKNPRRRT